MANHNRQNEDLITKTLYGVRVVEVVEERYRMSPTIIPFKLYVRVSTTGSKTNLGTSGDLYKENVASFSILFLIIV